MAVSSSTISKASATDLTIDATSTSATNAVKDVKIAGTSIGGANMSYTGVDATILSAYIASLDVGTYAIAVEFKQGNSVAYTLTVTA